MRLALDVGWDLEDEGVRGEEAGKGGFVKNEITEEGRKKERKNERKERLWGLQSRWAIPRLGW